ncbi:NADH-quinone oxidoreductase chain E [alpha proteobacterium BAL199]|jgi:NADH-quinone oxidoreductase E subunit|nr:NADH-quinone oxidoreductase chain E [alpha proteobacterium BAL199]
MSSKPIAEDKDQPASFTWTPQSEKQIAVILAKYPEGRQSSAVLPLLDLAQRQHDNWIPLAAIDAIAARLDMARIRVLEVATFYTMYNLAPVGKWFLQACTTTPCWLRGSDQMMRCIKDKLGLDNHGRTADGQFSLLEVECLGACVNAPILQVNDDFYEDMDYETTATLIDALKRGEPPVVGSMKGRQTSQSIAGPTSLESLKKSDGVPAWFAGQKAAAAGGDD